MEIDVQSLASLFNGTADEIDRVRAAARKPEHLEQEVLTVFVPAIRGILEAIDAGLFANHKTAMLMMNPGWKRYGAVQLVTFWKVYIAPWVRSEFRSRRLSGLGCDWIPDQDDREDTLHVRRQRYGEWADWLRVLAAELRHEPPAAAFVETPLQKGWEVGKVADFAKYVGMDDQQFRRWRTANSSFWEKIPGSKSIRVYRPALEKLRST